LTFLEAEPTRLGVRVELAPDEWLQSAISRWAWQVFRVSRAALLEAFGLSETRQPSIIGLGTSLSTEILTKIQFSTGIPGPRLRAATMQSLDGKLVKLEIRDDGSAWFAKHGTWAWKAGTRYCPDCMRERPGVFQVRWRSPWTFACLQHSRVLLDACSWCQGEIVEMRGRNTDVFNPSTCRADVARVGATRRLPCRSPLQESWDQSTLAPESPPLVAQRLIELHARQGSGPEYLRLLQATATGLRGAKAFEDIAALSGLDLSDIAGLFDDEKHVGVSAPSSAYAMAALIGASVALDQGGDLHSLPIIRRATFSRPPGPVPRRAGYGPGSPAELLSRWPKAPAPLRSRVLRAHDEDLTLGQRIIWDTAASPSTLAAHSSLRPTRGVVDWTLEVRSIRWLSRGRFRLPSG
jgi:hypothetical protein